MNILVADEEDIEALLQVEIESKKQSIPECIEDYELDYSARIYSWIAYFKAQTPQTSKPERIVLKALNKENQLVGYLAGHLTTRFNFDAEIQWMYILKQEQRKAIGTKLLTEFARWLIKQNAKSLCVGFKPENKYQSFYLKHGGQYLNEHWIVWQDVNQLLKK